MPWCCLGSAAGCGAAGTRERDNEFMDAVSLVSPVLRGPFTGRARREVAFCVLTLPFGVFIPLAGFFATVDAGLAGEPRSLPRLGGRPQAGEPVTYCQTEGKLKHAPPNELTPSVVGHALACPRYFFGPPNRYPRIAFTNRWSVACVTPTPIPKLNSHRSPKSMSTAGTICCSWSRSGSNPVDRKSTRLNSSHL